MGFKPLWTPWRGVLRRKRDEGCVFCLLPKETDDKKNLILYRGQRNFVILNKFPYTCGHLMVVPFRHTAEISGVEKADWVEMMELMQHSEAALREGYRPEGINLGMNMGAAAGAGIKEHLHLHVVPRWTGDSNFLPLMSGSKPLPQTLQETFDLLHPIFRRL